MSYFSQNCIVNLATVTTLSKLPVSETKVSCPLSTVLKWFFITDEIDSHTGIYDYPKQLSLLSTLLNWRSLGECVYCSSNRFELCAVQSETFVEFIECILWKYVWCTKCTLCTVPAIQWVFHQSPVAGSSNAGIKLVGCKTKPQYICFFNKNVVL